jgi:hypothetical protein
MYNVSGPAFKERGTARACFYFVARHLLKEIIANGLYAYFLKFTDTPAVNMNGIEL